MPAQLFLGDGAGRLIDASREAGDCWSVPRVGRGLAAGDLDNDGRVDVLILAQGGPLAYLHNLGNSQEPDRSKRATDTLTLQLEGTRSNHDGIGAKILVTDPETGRTQVVSRLGGGSFLSACDPRLHFGLGPFGPRDGEHEPTVNRQVAIEVRWPSGLVNRYEGVKIGTGYRLVEGASDPKPLIGW
jgi:hypothetical protein